MRIPAACLPAALLLGCGGSSRPTITYAMDAFTVGANEEVFKCQYFPPQAKDQYLSRLHSRMTAGSHHLIVFRVLEELYMAPGARMPCSQIDIPSGFNGLLFGAQTPEFGFELPQGVALHLGKDEGLVVQAHYLNTTGNDIHAQVEFDVSPTDSKAVMQTAGEVFLNNFALNIPPGVQIQTQSCAIPFDATLFNATGHMHRHGINFEAAIDNQMVYQTDQWDSPPFKIYNPTLQVRRGQTVRWTCTYNNNTDHTLHFGNSAATDEMCIFGGVYYPAPVEDGFANTFTCLGSMRP